MHGHEVGLELEGFAEMFDSLLMASESLQGQSEVVVCFGVVGIEASGGTSGAGGAFQLSESAISFGQVGVVERHARSEGDCAADLVYGLSVFAHLMVQDAAEVQCLGMVVPLLEDMVIQGGGLNQLPGLVHGQGLSQFVCHRSMLLRYVGWRGRFTRWRKSVIGQVTLV